MDHYFFATGKSFWYKRRVVQLPQVWTYLWYKKQWTVSKPRHLDRNPSGIIIKISRKQPQFFPNHLDRPPLFFNYFGLFSLCKPSCLRNDDRKCSILRDVFLRKFVSKRRRFGWIEECSKIDSLVKKLLVNLKLRWRMFKFQAINQYFVIATNVFAEISTGCGRIASG